MLCTSPIMPAKRSRAILAFSSVLVEMHNKAVIGAQNVEAVAIGC
jgi:hypothetical protein